MQVPMPPLLPPPTQLRSCGLHQGSLLFPLEGLDGLATAPRESHDQQSSQVMTLSHLLSLSLQHRWPRHLAADIRRLKREMLMDADSVDVVLLAAMLQDLGYQVVVRCALGGIKSTGANAGPGSCFRNLRHEFLYVRCDSGEYEGVEFLIDPNFKEQFAIPQPTARYRMLLDTVPEEFVGTSTRLQPVVELLCSEMAASFEARGLAVPPWRRASAMLSKWLPAKSKDYAIDLSSTSGASPPGHSPRARMEQAAAEADQPFTPFAPGSPERRLRKEAAQMLEALALHAERQASPNLSPRVSQALTLQPIELPLQLPGPTLHQLYCGPPSAEVVPSTRSAPHLMRASSGRAGPERVSLLSGALKATCASPGHDAVRGGVPAMLPSLRATSAIHHAGACIPQEQHAELRRTRSKVLPAPPAAGAAAVLPVKVCTTQPAVAGQPAIHKVKLLQTAISSNTNI